MPIPSAKTCLICGFDDCESLSKHPAVKESLARETNLPPSKLLDQRTQIQSAAELLANSKSPLICGLNCLDSAAQMVAWQLADQVRAIVDSSLVPQNNAAIQSLQRHGKVTATYGEIANRSDLVVFWNCDLQPKHACLLRMLRRDSAAKRVANRKTIFIGSADSPMAQVVDEVFAVESSTDRPEMVRLICRLRAQVAGQTLHKDRYTDKDLSPAKEQALFDLLSNARYGGLFFAPQEPDWEFDLETDSLLQLVSELNSVTRFVGIKVRDDLNGLGAETVMSLASGFPNSISLQRGQAMSTGSIYTAAESLRRKSCDTILLFGNIDTNQTAGEPDALPTWLQDELRRLTVIQLAPKPDSFADLWIECPTIEAGEAFAGTAFRGDGAMLTGMTVDAEHSAEAILRSLLSAYSIVLRDI